MKYVNTTLGPISPDQLGKVDMHDHVVIDRSHNTHIPEDFHHIDLDLIGADLLAWRAAGGGAIVDSSPIGAGRNVDLLVKASRATQVPIIISTGFHKLSYYPPEHWLFSASQEELDEILTHECTLGVLIDEDQPFTSDWHRVAANMLKVGVDRSGLTPVIRRIMDAAGAVSHAVGVPCMIHTEPGVPFEAVINYLAQTDFHPDKVVMCHMGKNLDPDLFISLAEKGFLLEFDEMVRPAPPLDALIKTIRALFEAGFGSSVLFAGDLARRSYWLSYGGQPGLAYLVSSLAELLEDLGLTEAMQEQIWVDNPRKLFA